MSKITRLLLIVFILLTLVSIAPFLVNNIGVQYENFLKPQVKVAAVKISGGIADSESYIKQLNTYFQDKSIKAILLEIDSPGGQAGSGQAIVNEINCLKKEFPKPVVVLTNNICASAGYYIASTADYIISSRSALVGSIGTSISFFNFSDIFKQYHVGYVNKHSGKYKAIASPYEPSNADNEKLLQSLADNCYEQFTTDVATNRKLSLKELDVWANGKVFTGEQALKLGLVDECGSKYNAIKKVRELALIKEDEKINWVKESGPSILNKFLQNKIQAAALEESVDVFVRILTNKLQLGTICNS